MWHAQLVQNAARTQCGQLETAVLEAAHLFKITHADVWRPDVCCPPVSYQGGQGGWEPGLVP